MNAVIMAGGTGSRLWPMSRNNFPKQLQKLVSDKSLIQETFERLKSFLPIKNIYVSTSDKYISETRHHLPELPEENYIIEPVGRNTAPAIALIAAHFAAREPKAIVATVAADHVVTKIDEFQKVLKTAGEAVKKFSDHVITVGLNPTEPATGLGYIQMNTLKSTINEKKIFSVKKFVEKPDFDTAKRYLASWEYLWNASYFIWRTDNIIKLFKTLALGYAKPIEKIKKAIDTPNQKKIIAEEFEKMPAGPIDTVIMEKTKKILVIPADLGWSDVGSWSSLHDILSLSTGSHIIAKGHHVGVDNHNCLIYASNKLVATIGLEDVVVVDTDDVLLICNKNKAQDIKKIIDKLKDEGKHLYL